jgi:hypothetical protein
MTSTAFDQRVGGQSATVVERAGRFAEVVVAVLLAGALGLALVQPWKAIPFPVADFGGWLALLSSSGSAVDGFRALVEEHAREGRVNPLSMAYVALNWGLFDARPVGWQWMRAAIMLAVIAIAFVLFRTLGAKPVAGAVGAAFFVIADSGRSVWVLPQAIEHLATLFVLLASYLATTYYIAARPTASAIGIAVLLVLAVWVREPMVAAVPFVLLLALSHRGEGRLALPTVERRSALLVSVTGAAVMLLNVIPVIGVRFLEHSSGYASRFGMENISLGNVKNVLSALFLPVTREPLFPANVLFLIAIALAALGSAAAARRYRTWLALAATLPMCAAAIYVMWPSFPGNYALPYLPATALAFALALSVLWDASPLGRAVAVVSALAVIGYGALLGVNGTRQYTAARLLDADMATFVSGNPSSRLVVAVDDPRVSGEFGRALVLYATATRGRASAQASDVACVDAERLTAALSPDVVVLRPADACHSAGFGPPTTLLRRTALIRDWKTLGLQRWEATAAFWHGESVP